MLHLVRPLRRQMQGHRAPQAAPEDDNTCAVDVLALRQVGERGARVLLEALLRGTPLALSVSPVAAHQ